MALPIVPAVIGVGLVGTGGFITGSLTSETLGNALLVGGAVVGVFLVLMLLQQLGWLQGG